MKRMIFFGGLVLALTAGAEARDWGFDKDTVYEWNPGRDTVWLVNNGTDTLVLDSLFADDIDSSIWLEASFSYRALGPPLSENIYYSYFLAQLSHRERKMAGDRIPPGDSVMLYDFDLALACPTAKASGLPLWMEDTLMMRMRFKSTVADEDTLIVMGHYCTTSIMLPPSRLRPSIPVLDRDPLGRKSVPSRNFPFLIKPSE